MNATQSSWNKALDVFNSRIANTTLDHNAKLRRLGSAVGGVYSDFLAKLPDAEALILAARAHETGQRIEGSQDMCRRRD